MTCFPEKLALCTGFALVCTPLAAQESDWSFDATIYLFAAETKTSMDTRFGEVESTLSFSDALSDLDFAFMGAFSACNGRWSILADYMYTDLSTSDGTPGPVFSGVNTTATTQILNGYVAYRVYEADDVKLDAAAGFRWFGTKTTFVLDPGVASERSTSVDDNWIDPVIGARAQFRMSDRWAGTAFVDYGGFSSGNETWQVLLTADYALNDRWLLRGGYRYITVDHKIDGNDFRFSQSGPVFGATYQF
ncbi:outer membrane beta-barrel protein [Ruegeria arenilitoris]|uniref:outer membrane beta-barrel protein n=1 Tax=Ruegeria arenilitoris TaxID=1173585 RepID=UPI00147C4211|nr:outer membrane beta-barrel protein [Ruegeria arenilitoris]